MVSLEFLQDNLFRVHSLAKPAIKEMRKHVGLLLMLLCIFYWVHLSGSSFWAFETQYHGDAVRYAKTIDLLRDSLDKGNLAALLPLSPTGEKPLFIYLGFLASKVVDHFDSAYANSGLLLVGGLSVVWLSLAAYLLITRITGDTWIGLAAGVISLFNFDISFHAHMPSHNMLGIALILTGLYFYFCQFPFAPALAGVFLGMAIFASPHMLPFVMVLSAWVAMQWLVSWQKGQPFKKAGGTALDIAVGGATTILVSIGIYLLQKASGYTPQHPFQMMKWEAEMAKQFQSAIPFMYDFTLEYGLQIYLFVALFLATALATALGLRFANKLQGFAAVDALLFLALGTIVLLQVARMPLIARVYSLPLLLLLYAGLMACKKLMDNYLKQESLRIVLVLGFCFASYQQAVWLETTDMSRNNNHFYATLEQLYPDLKVIPSREVDFDNLEEKLPKTMLILQSTEKFAHSILWGCEFEIFVSRYIAEGNRVEVAVKNIFPLQYCFLNEYGYVGFCRGKWNEVFSIWPFLNFLQPDKIYAIKGDLLLNFYRSNKEIVPAMKCPSRGAFDSKNPETL